MLKVSRLFASALFGPLALSVCEAEYPQAIIKLDIFRDTASDTYRNILASYVNIGWLEQLLYFPILAAVNTFMSRSTVICHIHCTLQV